MHVTKFRVAKFNSEGQKFFISIEESHRIDLHLVIWYEKTYTVDFVVPIHDSSILEDPVLREEIFLQAEKLFLLIYPSHDPKFKSAIS